eukprot:TRINITY_DN6167_c0_g1_i1.p1 TRINITY_DN6167_c0_g1~~TRINITY_DN6167_c0_g1_i1.p1  ORF type:complete len:156 (-),score=44.58 TRINITY_DN6167_c0_g1_i1:238-705(-)
MTLGLANSLESSLLFLSHRDETNISDMNIEISEKRNVKKRKGEHLFPSQEVADSMETIENGSSTKYMKKEEESPIEEEYKPSYTRQNRFRFKMNPQFTFPCKVICREPWGTMVESTIDSFDENGNQVRSGSRMWCKKESDPIPGTSPVYEVLHFC